MNKINTYRDLIVWQKSKGLALDIYKVTQVYPNEEKFGLVSQLRRAAVSIPSNIAEGYGRHSSPEYSRFLKISLGSVYEIQTQLEISFDLKYIKANDYKSIFDLSREIEAMLMSLIRKLPNKLN